MTSQLNDTDDENCDDPIKLFPSSFNNTVNFGSQSQIIGTGDINWKFQTTILTHGRYNEFSQKHNESHSECTIVPMFVKLVDCVKFPWYFKKHTAQLLQKADLNQFETEHDFIDVDKVKDKDSFICFEDFDSDSSDCFIVEDLHPEITSTSDYKERQKRFKLDNELQNALSQRQLHQVDLKRNIGLIGLKISQKKYTKIKQDASTSKKTKKKLIAKSDKEEMRFHFQSENNEKTCSSLTVPVHFNINKIPKNIMNNLKTKMNSDHNNKDANGRLTIFSVHKLSKKVPTSNISKKSSNTSTCHVKDIKKCNKYKNDQIKNKNKTSINSILIEMLESNQTLTKTCIVPELEQNRGEQTEKRQNDNNKEEPKSPILKCTTLKKPKPTTKPEISPAVKCNNVNTKPQEKLDKIVNKLKMLNKMPFNGSTILKPCELPTNNASTKEIKEKVGSPNSVISEKLLEKLDKSIKYYNNHNKNVFRTGKLDRPQCMQSNSNDIEVSIPSNVALTGNPTSAVNNNKIMIPPNTDCTKTNLQVKTCGNSQELSNQSNDFFTSNVGSNTNASLEAPKQNINAVGNLNVSSTTIVKPSRKANSSIPANHYASTNDCLKPQFIVHSLPRNLFHKNNPNNNANVSPQNQSASTKILKNKGDLPVESKSEHVIHSTTAQMPRMFHNPQTQCHDSRGPNIYNSTNLDNQQNLPNLVNQGQPTNPNQCRLPNNKIYQQAHPVPNFYTKRVLLPLPPPPPPMYVPPPYIYQTKQSYSNSSYRSSIVVPNQSTTSASQDCIRSLQPDNINNSSIIGINNDGLVKKINIAGGPKLANTDPQEWKNNKDVVSKTSSAGHREIVANNLQMLDKTSLAGDNKSSKIGDRAINDTKIEKSMEVAIMSKNRAAFETLKLSVDNINMQPKQSKGYSPPILPIPTYNKILNHVTPKALATVSKDLAKKNRIPKIPVKKVDGAKNNKRKVGALNIADNRKKIGAKKISLEEYNKRALKDSKSMPSKRIVGDDQNKQSRKRPNRDNKNNRDHNTETDLGYDSDSTVIL